jgi:hypothetical protein
MDVKNEMTGGTNGGRRTLVVTPDTGNVMFRRPLTVPPEFVNSNHDPGERVGLN